MKTKLKAPYTHELPIKKVGEFIAALKTFSKACEEKSDPAQRRRISAPMRVKAVSYGRRVSISLFGYHDTCTPELWKNSQAALRSLLNKHLGEVEFEYEEEWDKEYMFRFGGDWYIRYKELTQ